MQKNAEIENKVNNLDVVAIDDESQINSDRNSEDDLVLAPFLMPSVPTAKIFAGRNRHDMYRPVF